MVQAMINIPERINHILNIIKARNCLKDKSEAITFVVGEYGTELLEPELRPEFVSESKNIMNENKINIGSIGDFKSRYNID